MRALIALTAAVAALCLSVDARAQATIDGSDPAAIAKIISGFGTAEVEKDGEGDPKIVGRIEGIRYALYFYECEENAKCKSVSFAAGFTGTNANIEKMNEWNRERRFGEAHLDDEGDPWITMPVNLRHGVTRENFDDTVDWWRVVTKQFEEFVYK